MDNNFSLSEHPPCLYCGSTQILKNGSTHHKKPKFLCKHCRRQFIENPQKKSISTDSKTLIQKLLLEKISLRRIARSVGVSMTGLQKFVNNLYRSFPGQLKVLPASSLELELECDELWSFVNCQESAVYIWLALVRSTRIIVGFYLGDRTRKTAFEFWSSYLKTLVIKPRFIPIYGNLIKK